MWLVPDAKLDICFCIIAIVDTFLLIVLMFYSLIEHIKEMLQLRILLCAEVRFLYGGY